eukprot:9475362-Pyramimonas_sp.AAC.1
MLIGCQSGTSATACCARCGASSLPNDMVLFTEVCNAIGLPSGCAGPCKPTSARANLASPADGSFASVGAPGAIVALHL